VRIGLFMAFVLSTAEWIEATRLSAGIRESVWIYPAIEGLHVLGLALFLGLTVVMDLRLVGRVLTQVHVADVMGRLLPWIRWGFAGMVATGLLLTIATPVAFAVNPFFQAKLVFLALAGVNVRIFYRTLYPTVQQWGGHRRPPARARFAGGASLFFWIAIVVTGRFIAYNWFN
jgi:hypothetical protein